MKPKIYHGRMNVNFGVEIDDTFGPGEAHLMHKTPCYIIPKNHHLYQEIESRIERQRILQWCDIEDTKIPKRWQDHDKSRRQR